MKNNLLPSIPERGNASTALLDYDMSSKNARVASNLSDPYDQDLVGKARRSLNHSLSKKNPYT